MDLHSQGVKVMIGEAMLMGAIGGAVLFLVVLAYVTIEESIRN